MVENCEYCMEDLVLTRDFSFISPHTLASQAVLQSANFEADPLPKIEEWFEKDNKLFPCAFDFIEHTSANCTGAPHVGNFVNSIIGDLYQRNYRSTSKKPVFYVNDNSANFKKFLVAAQRHPQILLEQVYAKKGKEMDTEALKMQEIYEGIPESTRKTHRDQMLKLIGRALSQLNVMYSTSFQYIYESDYNGTVSAKYLKDKGFDASLIEDSEGLHYNNLRLTSSRVKNGQFIPTYAYADLLYRNQMLTSYTRLLFIMGKDHEKHEKYFHTAFKDYTKKVVTVLYPIVTIGGLKASKRNNTMLNIKDLLGKLEFISPFEPFYFKVLILKYYGADTFEVNYFLDHSNIKQFKKICSSIDMGTGKDLRKLYYEIPLEKRKELSFWVNIPRIIHRIFQRGDLNKLYSFLKHIERTIKQSDPSLAKVNKLLFRAFLELTGLL